MIKRISYILFVLFKYYLIRAVPIVLMNNELPYSVELVISLILPKLICCILLSSALQQQQNAF